MVYIERGGKLKLPAWPADEARGPAGRVGAVKETKMARATEERPRTSIQVEGMDLLRYNEYVFPFPPVAPSPKQQVEAEEPVFRWNLTTQQWQTISSSATG